ncbi:hypothetical protein MFIFM68171_04639 [Madurella fahalii]|uniref:Uncharacterized protein n=1 Tax=Madurella fahalii TaxID=1157608 RepID=A0ABQ0G9T0_9PEZI
MATILLLLVALFQVTLSQQYFTRGCADTIHEVNANDCHQVIDGFSQYESSGYITLGPGDSLTIYQGSCEGILINNMKTSININEATVAFNMTAHIFNICITGGMYGGFKTNEITAKLYRNSEGSEPESQLGRRERGRRLRGAAERSRKETRMADEGESGSACFASFAYDAVFNSDDCHQAIDVISQVSESGYIQLQPGNCLVRRFGTCTGWVCNKPDYYGAINEATLAWQMTANIFNPCITQKDCGHWWDEDIWGGLCNDPPDDVLIGWYLNEVSIFDVAKSMRLDPIPLA